MRRRRKAPMLCPYCLADVVFSERVEKRRNGFARAYLACGQCEQEVPRMYVADYRRYPPAVVSAVGFTQHGKSVYFSSLFYTLRHLDLATKWPGFVTQCLSDESVTNVWAGARDLNQGRLPDATAKVFPTPVMLRLDSFPGQPNCTLIVYDTAGESFNRPTQLVQYARFVSRASTVLFFVSLSRIRQDNEDIDQTLHRLLETYIVGVRELGAEERSQKLMVVFTMADAIGQVVGDSWQPLRDLLIRSHPGDEQSRAYVARTGELSRRLHRLTREELKAQNFLNLAEQFFRSVGFSMVSALGAAPLEDNTMAMGIIPRRVFDPLLSVFSDVKRARPLWRRVFD